MPAVLREEALTALLEHARIPIACFVLGGRGTRRVEIVKRYEVGC
jgi:hypothetical protein